MKELKITIDKFGRVSIDASGFIGKECIKETEDLEKALGTVKERKFKPEYNKKVKITPRQRAVH